MGCRGQSVLGSGKELVVFREKSEVSLIGRMVLC